MAQAFAALTEKPTAENLQAARGLLVSDPAYSPYSDDLTQLKNLLHQSKNREVLALLKKSQPNLALSPRAHRFAAEAAKRIGDMNSAAREMAAATCCEDAIRATGDGSESHPFLVARMSDEEDLLAAKFQTRIDSQGLIFRDDQKYDRVLGHDGRTYWFDVGMLIRPEKAEAVETPVAATPLVQRGIDAYRAGRNDEALSIFDEAIKLEPGNAGAYVERGNVWYVQQQYERAIADFSEAIHLDPKCATAYCNRAFALDTLGGLDEAVTDFNAAIRLQASFGRAYNGRGRVFQSKGMIDTAIADFDEAIRLEPNYAAAHESRSLAYAKKGDAALAEADAAKARDLRGVKTVPAVSPVVAEKPAGK